MVFKNFSYLVVAGKVCMIVAISIWLSACSMFGIRSVEEASYESLLVQEDFEVRQYAPVMMVVTSADAKNFDESSDKTFNRLFKYITGNNVQAQSIDMTAPVFSSSLESEQGQKIAMTAPVFSRYSQPGSSSWSLAFVLPASFDRSNTPVPSDPSVKLVEQPARLMAVRTFTGFWSQERFDTEIEALKEWIKQNSYVAQGPALFAGYDPPWTLPFLRRNEVMLEINK